ncbi:hypothetical protein GWO43_02165 [candidate division KSB1 bacterium]|nr:hypothetical protein [candidate division KSB1 bacterium]NIR69647.1 hypothetical protein [candidate division KSB1 bacterium]NIS22876.1 hypothetical protein [candidate division KSB1 bacterium]NIT69714.1 hypothetical protein [candidate division KSB1 bacterium]NIU23382.1 hypothetical protein [candidate division KSB1 bacterium]
METAKVKVGEEFLIHAKIRNARKAYSFETSLIFPSDALEVVRKDGKLDIQMGNFLGDGADMLSNLSINASKNTGTLLIGYTLSGPASEKDGDGLLFSVRAKALKPGDYRLEWASNSKILDSTGEEQPKNFEDLPLEITKDNPNVNVIFLTIEEA